MSQATIRPNAAGTYTELIANAGSNYANVDETTPDEDSTYNYSGYGVGYKCDTYNIPNQSLSGTINWVRVYIRCRNTEEGELGTYKSREIVYIGSTRYYGAYNDVPNSYSTVYYQWSTNPNTSSAWTWQNINDLEIGVELYCGLDKIQTRCTQVYVVVDYTEAPTEYDVAITEGLDLGESILRGMTAELGITDGLKSGDSLGQSSLMSLLTTDGTKLGDSIAAALAYYLDLVDGLKAGDTKALDMQAYLDLADGIHLGDTPLVDMIASLISSDGLKLGETVLTTAMLSVGDGVKLGEGVGGAGGWVSPTGHNDEDGYWYNETLAYDDDLGQRAWTTAVGHYLQLTHSAISCDKIRVYVNNNQAENTSVTIQVYYSAAWHTLYSGDHARGTWVEHSIGSTQTVTAMRLKSNESCVFYWYEADFNEVGGGAATPIIEMSAYPILTDGFKLGDLTASELVGIYVEIAEGLKAGDLTGISMLANLELADGTKFGDTKLLAMIAGLAVADGIKAGDTTAVAIGYMLLLEDGMSLGDVLTQITAKVYAQVSETNYSEAISYPNARMLARTSDGVLHAVYIKLVGDPIYEYHVFHAYSSNAGVTWSEEQISTSESYYPSMTVDSKDNLHVVWTGYNDDCLYYRNHNGSSWESITTLSNTGDNVTAAIAVDSKDNIHVVWDCWDSPNSKINYIKYSEGGWGSITAIHTDTYDCNQPSIAIDDNDYIHVVFNAKVTGASTYYGIYYLKYTTSWQARETVAYESGYSQYDPCVAVDSSGNVHVVWGGKHSGDTSWNQIRYRQRTSSWQTIVNLTTGSYGKWYPSVAVDSSDYIYAVWEGISADIDTNNCYRIFLRKYDGSWGSIIDLTSRGDDHVYPNLLWARHPSLVNTPESGYAFLWSKQDDPETVWYYASLDFTLATLIMVIEGLKLGDTTVQDMLALLEAADGVDFGDLTSGGLAIYVELADGLHLGETNTLELALGLAILDGIKMGDSNAAEMLAYLSASDIVKLGDESLLSMLAQLAITDGAKLGDVTALGLALFFIITDGMSFSDEMVQYMAFGTQIMDGVKMGDTISQSMLATLLVADGVKLGDVKTVSMIANLLIQEGVSLGDITDLLAAVVEVAIAEGISMGDVPAISMLATLSILDGIKLGDVKVLDYLGYLINLWLSTRTYHDLRVFTSTYHDINLLTKTYHDIGMCTKTYHDITILTKTYHDVKIWTGDKDMIRRDWQRGETVPIWAEVKLASTGALYDPTHDPAVVLWLYDEDGTTVLDEVTMEKDDTGMYVYYWNSPVDAALGKYRPKSKAQDGSGDSAKITIENYSFVLHA